MSFSQNEKIKLAEKALLAGVLDADPAVAWYESVNPWSVTLPAKKIWTQATLLRAHPASNLAAARSNASGPLSGVVQDLSQYSSAVRLTPFPGINNTYAALSTYGSFSSSRLEDWIQPQFVPQANGLPSNGYAVRLFDGNPASGGTEVLTTDGTTGTGVNKSVAWVWNYSGGILALADDFDVADPWIVGFRYIGQTVEDLSSETIGDVSQPSGLVTSSMSSGLFGYMSSNNTVSRTDASLVSKARCVGAYEGVPGKITSIGVIESAIFSSASGTPTVGSPVFLARADDETSGGAAGKLTTNPPTSGAATLVGTVLSVNPVTFPSTRVSRILLQIAPPIKRA